MYKKIYILSILAVLIIAVGAILFFNKGNTLPQNNNNNSIGEVDLINSIPINSIPKNINCENREEEVRQLLDNANYCNTGSDCATNTEFWCPFGCYNLVNKDADLTKIANKVKLYKESCPICVYDCNSAPTQENIICKNNKCIDTRY